MNKIRKKNDQDLRKDLVELRDSLQTFRFGVAGSKVRDMKEGRNVRKDIARHLTEQRARRGARP